MRQHQRTVDSQQHTHIKPLKKGRTKRIQKGLNTLKSARAHTHAHIRTTKNNRERNEAVLNKNNNNNNNRKKERRSYVHDLGVHKLEKKK